MPQQPTTLDDLLALEKRALELTPYEAPPPPPPSNCPGCEAFRPECLVPGEARGQDTPVPMCWLCAHLAVMHDAAEIAPSNFAEFSSRCGCAGHEIYPWAAAVRNDAIETSADPTPRWREGGELAKATRRRAV